MKTTTMELEEELARKSADESPEEAAENAVDGTADPEEIARLAYRYWEERGCPYGSAEVDWYRAENELAGRTR